MSWACGSLCGPATRIPARLSQESPVLRGHLRMRTRFVSDSRSRSWPRAGRSGAGRPFRAAPVRKRELLVKSWSIRSRSKSRSTIGPTLGAVPPATPGPGRRAMKRRVCFIAPSVSAGCGSARTPTDEDKVRFGFLLPLPLLVEDRSIRSRAPIPSRARKEAPAPGRGVAIGDSRGKSRSTIGPAAARFLRRLPDRGAGR